MIKAVSKFDKSKAQEMSNSSKKGSLISNIILTVIMIILGVLYIITGENIVFKIIGIVLIVICPLPIIFTIRASKKETKELLDDLNVENSELILEYVIKEKRIEITARQNNKAETTTVMIKNLSEIRTLKTGIALYVSNGDMYYIDDKDFTMGTKQQLISQLVNAGIKHKKK